MTEIAQPLKPTQEDVDRCIQQTDRLLPRVVLSMSVCIVLCLVWLAFVPFGGNEVRIRHGFRSPIMIGADIVQWLVLLTFVLGAVCWLSWQKSLMVEHELRQKRKPFGGASTLMGRDFLLFGWLMPGVNMITSPILMAAAWDSMANRQGFRPRVPWLSFGLWWALFWGAVFSLMYVWFTPSDPWLYLVGHLTLAASGLVALWILRKGVKPSRHVERKKTRAERIKDMRSAVRLAGDYFGVVHGGEIADELQGEERLPGEYIYNAVLRRAHVYTRMAWIDIEDSYYRSSGEGPSTIRQAIARITDYMKARPDVDSLEWRTYSVDDVTELPAALSEAGFVFGSTSYAMGMCLEEAAALDVELAEGFFLRRVTTDEDFLTVGQVIARVLEEHPDQGLVRGQELIDAQRQADREQASDMWSPSGTVQKPFEPSDLDRQAWFAIVNQSDEMVCVAGIDVSLGMRLGHLLGTYCDPRYRGRGFHGVLVRERARHAASAGSNDPLATRCDARTRAIMERFGFLHVTDIVPAIWVKPGIAPTPTPMPPYSQPRQGAASSPLDERQDRPLLL